MGVSPSTALEGTRALRERGVIRGAVLDVDLAAIGRGVQARHSGLNSEQGGQPAGSQPEAGETVPAVRCQRFSDCIRW